MGAHAELPPNHRRHPLGRPYLADKAVRFRAFAQQVRQLRPLLCGQLRRPTRRRAMVQRGPSALPRSFQPLADRTPRHPQRLGDARARPALLEQFQRPRAPALLPIVWSSFRLLVHAYQDSTATLYCLRPIAEVSSRPYDLFATLSRIRHHDPDKNVTRLVVGVVP